MSFAVVTRDPEATAPYAAALAALGLETIAMPVTRSEPPHDPHALRRALEAGGYIAILVASPRAASALVDARTHALLPEVWAVGAATARPLEAAHVAAIVPQQARDGATLARALLAARDLAGKRVLVPRAEDGRDDALEILRAGGVEVDAIVAYRTVAVAADDPAIRQGCQLLADGGAAVSVVFAPSQVAALDALLGVRRIVTRWAAIGETTAIALREAGAELVAVAATPTPEGIANAVAAVYPPQR
jgi:uroporphyrinogen-III synthase